ncbi:MAG: hypothetical protein U0271_19875 [Polyangiaceae bacterium]
MSRFLLLGAVCAALLGCGDSGSPAGAGGNGGAGGAGTGGSPDIGGAGAGHFTYTVADRVFRIQAAAGATAEDVSSKLEQFGAGTRDRWLVQSPDGQVLAVSTDRLGCSLGECLATGPADLSSLTLLQPGGAELAVEGTPALTSGGDAVVYSSQDGPHDIDLWITHREGSAYSAPSLLTADSPYAFNNMPAMTFDEQSVLFDCGAEPYPESGATNACVVRLDGTNLETLVRPDALPNPRYDFIQFPHDSLDGVLFQGTWPIGEESPETIWLLPSAGEPTPIGADFSNAVSPCGLRDGRFGLLWLGGPDNQAGLHELALVDREGKLIAVLTPGVDVDDIGIGCSD